MQPSAAIATDPETDLYRRGKEILGNSAGGMIKNLLASKGGDIALARAALETASTKSNPREYIGGVTRKSPAANEFRDNPMAGSLI